MAKKQKNESNLGKTVEDLIADAGDDRDRIVEFLEQLITKYGNEPGAIAEYVAKLSDSLTKQLQVRTAAIKVMQKEVDPEADAEVELEDIAKEIGQVFGGDASDEGSN